MNGSVWALGLMSGTSMDGIDAALVRTNGERVDEIGPVRTCAYDRDMRSALSAAVTGQASEDEIGVTERLLTEAHAVAVEALLAGASPAMVPAVIGFHGHTLWHRPEEGRTRQVGDGKLLARMIGYPVITDFRSADMAAGGEGAPLAPLYHRARVATDGIITPVVVLNIGGVANLTWIGNGSDNGADAVVAFDTGPGCAFLDDWAERHTGRPCDEGGKLALAGRVDDDALALLAGDPYFDRPPPKSLDRFGFAMGAVDGLSVEDGAATLVAFTAAAVTKAIPHLPAPPRRWLVTGGGRRNPALMAALAAALDAPVEAVEQVGWNGDALEAEAFAFLAVRSLKGLPLSVPATTGAAAAVSGGCLARPDDTAGSGTGPT